MSGPLAASRAGGSCPCEVVKYGRMMSIGTAPLMPGTRCASLLLCAARRVIPAASISRQRSPVPGSAEPWLGWCIRFLVCGFTKMNDSRMRCPSIFAPRERDLFLSLHFSPWAHGNRTGGGAQRQSKPPHSSSIQASRAQCFQQPYGAGWADLTAVLQGAGTGCLPMGDALSLAAVSWIATAWGALVLSF